MSAFCLMILVGISRSWEAFQISSSQVTFLKSSRLTFPKENLQPEFSSFILIMLGCFSKVLIAFSIGSLYSLEISQRLMLRPSTIRPKDFHNFVYFRNSCITFNEYYFSSFSVFSVKVGFMVYQKDLLSVIFFTLRLL